MTALCRFCEGQPQQSFAAGGVLFTEGDRTNRLYVLIDGEVAIIKGDVLVCLVGDAGAVFGEISALLAIPHSATVKAVRPCTVYVVQEADAFLREQAEFTYLLSKLLARRLLHLVSYLVDFKAQFADRPDHFSMVDEVLGTLMFQPQDEFTGGSERYPDVKI